MKIVLISVTVVMFLYSTIQAAVSDAFWDNAPLIIGSLTVFLTAAVAGAISLWKFVASLKKDVKEVHTLVNGNYGLQLKLNAVNARRVADLTKSPVDMKAAKEAEDLLADHQRQEAIVDLGEGTE